MDILTKKDIQNCKERIDSIEESLDLPTKRERLEILEKKTLDKEFWSNSNTAKSIMKEIQSIKSLLNKSQRLINDISSLEELYDITDDKSLLTDEYIQLLSDLNEFEKFQFLSGKYDNLDAILSIHAGQGGTESNDWANMLLRMYKMYCDKKGWKYTIEEILSGSEVGISSATLKISGEYVYGLLKKEHGTHRLVRISPYNAQGLRQTTFAGVEVIPILESLETDIDIPDSDIEFKAVRAGGPGGQKVNKTSSAVQITHIPTGITVHSSTQRSQAQNRENAINILKSKLAKIMEDERLSKIDDIIGDYKQASWGNQIRNYVLHPYKLVKDLRTNVESNDPESVLDGNIDNYIEAQLRIQ